MQETKLNEFICLKEYINKKEYDEINRLEKLCNQENGVNLKLELDYKLSLYDENNKSDIGLKNINEFLYYIDGNLAAYIGISSFGGRGIGEINGMTHPKWRKKGIFEKLFKLVIDECSKRNFKKILLLTDGKSDLGSEFIKNHGGNYDFSEYRMKLTDKVSLGNVNSVNLRKAENRDKNEIRRQDSIFFSDEEEIEGVSNEDELNISIDEKISINNVYMAEVNGEVIGKIKIKYEENSAFIGGFGILPWFRGKGYGKETLKEALKLINNKEIVDIELDVESKNDRALNIYKYFGFREVSVMDYYKYR